MDQQLTEILMFGLTFVCMVVQDEEKLALVQEFLSSGQQDGELAKELFILAGRSYQEMKFTLNTDGLTMN